MKKIFFLGLIAVSFFCVKAQKENNFKKYSDSLSSEKDPLQRQHILARFVVALQSQSPDSAVLFGLSYLQNDTRKILTEEKGIVLYNLGIAYRSKNNFDSALFFQFQAYDIRKQLNDKKGAGQSSNSIGLVYKNKGEFEKAIKYFTIALQLRMEVEDLNGVASTLNNLATIYKNKGDFSKALDYFFRSIKIDEAQKNFPGLIASYNNLGLLYRSLSNDSLALSYFQKALLLNKDFGTKKEFANSYNNIGIIYQNRKDFKAAEENYKKAERIRIEMNDELGLAWLYNSFGNLYHDMKREEDAISFYKKAIALQTKVNDKRGAVSLYNNVGTYYYDLGNYKAALEFALKAKSLSEKIETKNLSAIIYFDLGNIYSRLGKPDSAFYFSYRYSQLHDSLLREENDKRIIGLEEKYRSEKREKELSEINLKNVAALEKQKARTTLYISAILIMLLLTVLLLFRIAAARKAKRVAEEKEKEISKKNEEIEMLIREIHHRVKNNLQLTGSFINIEMRKIKDEKTKEIFTGLKNRIKAMILVHKKLYGKENYSSVFLDEYLEELTNELISGDENTAAVFETEKVQMDADSAVLLGISLNEIITNSLKYAHPPEGEKLLIRIGLKKVNGSIELNVSDNGKNSAVQTEISESSFGTGLVRSVAEKLNGTLKITFDDGCKYQLLFPSVRKKDEQNISE